MLAGTPAKRFLVAIVSALPVPASAAPAREKLGPPPNAPAAVEWKAEERRLSLRYHGETILEATFVGRTAGREEVRGVDVKLEPTVTSGEKVEQRLTFTLPKAQEGVELVLRGTVRGSEEAFPAETRGGAQDRFPCVRNSVGLSRNLRNNAIYDRRWDWMLIGPTEGATRIRAERIEARRIVFSWESRGSNPELVFRPLSYHKHRELEHFEPWAYRAWKGSLTGYCTWWAYRNGFSQTMLDEIVDVFAEKHLPDFGYEYIQLDDCYQIGNGNSPRGWLTWNDRWPGGPEHTIRKIRSAGMKPGIWVHRVHRANGLDVKEIVAEHPDWFVRKPDGEPFLDNGFYCLNTHNEEALEGMARVTYRALRKQGWEYVKIDGTGDLLWAYNKAPEFFEKIGKTPGETLRKWDVAAREELGPDVYILACWGVHPSLNVIGLVDGCRLGSDGFGTAEFQRFNSWNGVVWRNDPDHCDIMGEYYMDPDAMMTVFGAKAPVPMRTIIRPALCSVAGGVLMVSDKAEVYEDDLKLEGMRRSAPVLFTVPGQLYDYSPRGRGQYHAGLHGGEAEWWMLEIDRPFDHWSVLARFQWGVRQGEQHRWELQGVPERKVAFADLGLPDAPEYLVFEFWTQTFLGSAKGSFTAPSMDDDTGLQVFAIREARPHPWILSTTRHLSQGGVSLLDERWDGDRKVLSGRSAVVIDDPYVMTVHLPDGFRLESAEVDGTGAEIVRRREVAAVRFVPLATKTVEWKMAFASQQ
ncbi:MAG: alpha-galactosidase [Planctomycetes bacterium]|nr:alpha-galactosidase [Planctomycetota bacterium]